MKHTGSFLLTLVTVGAAVLATSVPAAAQSFYREDFGLPGETGTTLAAFGWDPTHIGTADALNTANMNSAGVVPGNSFHWWFNFTQLQNPIVTVTEASVTMEFAPITPIPDLAISWEQRLENMQDNSFTATTGNPAVVRIAVQMNGADWYASNSPYATTDTGVGGGLNVNYDAYSLPFDPAPANWRNLTLNTIVPMSATPQGATIGGTPASALTGNITGVGFVTTFSQYQTINFNFIEIAVPPVPGDVDGDGDVDTTDFGIIRTNLSTAVDTRAEGDLNGDGVVDLLDFGEWKDNHPFPGAASGTADSASAPEPATAALIALAIVLGLSGLNSRNGAWRRRGA